MNAFKDALRPLPSRFPRIAREHEILRVAADLPTDHDAVTTTEARRQILLWAQNRSGGVFPSEAFAGQSFDHLSAGRNSSALRLQRPAVDIWAIRQDDPDKTVPGRIWTTEAVVWTATGQSPHIAARLMVGTNEDAPDIAPHVPGFVQQLIEHCGITSGGVPIRTRPWFVDSQDEEDALLTLLTASSRRLPLIVISVAEGSDAIPLIDPLPLARAVAGLAHVAVILPVTSHILTERFERLRSVFGGAVRVYMPGFDEDTDPYLHPLTIAQSLNTLEKADHWQKRIRETVARFSLRAVRLGEHILQFSSLRTINLEAKQEALAAEGASDVEQLAAAEARIASLVDEVTEAKNYEKLANENYEAAEHRARLAEAQSNSAAARVQQLISQVRNRGIDPDDQITLPSSWDTFAEWCDRELVGRIVLTPSARRGCKKALYANVEQVARCLLWLANDCRTRFIEGGGSIRDEPIEDGIRNAPCGGDAYDLGWQSGRLLRVDWHIKTGGNSRAPENCLRIYYCWDDATQQIIVADMPAHRSTRAS